MKSLLGYSPVNTVPFTWNEGVASVAQGLGVLAADAQEAIYTSTIRKGLSLNRADLILRGPVRLQRQQDHVNRVLASARAGNWQDDYLHGLASGLRQLMDQLAIQQEPLIYADLFWTQGQGRVTGAQFGFMMQPEASNIINGIAVLFGHRLQPLFSIPGMPRWLEVQDQLDLLDAPTDLGFGYSGALHLYENPHDFHRLRPSGGYVPMVTEMGPQNIALLNEAP